jgi:hypothetical protein
VSRFMASALFVWIVVFSLGCADKALGPVGAETLIDRWRAVTKGDADEGNATRDAPAPTGETVAFRYEFLLLIFAGFWKATRPNGVAPTSDQGPGGRRHRLVVASYDRQTKSSLAPLLRWS